jgi:hypothetical protein
MPPSDKPPAASPLLPPPAPTRFKVRATKLGYYDDKRRRIGDVFWVSARQTDTGRYVEFAESWMERVPEATPESITTGQQELRRQHDEIVASKRAGALAASSEAPARSPLDE